MTGIGIAGRAREMGKDAEEGVRFDARKRGRNEVGRSVMK
jgi:hypothetical protein